MKDLPIWARWNGQQVLGITPGKNGWHTYYFRRNAHGAPLPRLADAIVDAIVHGMTHLLRIAGKPWRRLGAIARPKG